MRTVTMGTEWFSATITCRPLSSVVRCTMPLAGAPWVTACVTGMTHAAVMSAVQRKSLFMVDSGIVVLSSPGAKPWTVRPSDLSLVRPPRRAVPDGDVARLPHHLRGGGNRDAGDDGARRASLAKERRSRLSQ